MFNTTTFRRAAAILFVLTFAGPVAAQSRAYLQLEIDGDVITLGETNSNLVGPDFVEIESYALGLESIVSNTGGSAGPRLDVKPIEFTKAITPSSVLLRRALAEGRIVSAEIRIYASDGSELAELYRVNAINALVTRIAPYYGPGPMGEVFYESIALLPSALSFLHVPSGTTYDLQSNLAP